MLESGEGTTSGAADQAHPVVTWEIAPLRAAALRTERAVNQRWQTLRAAIIGGALLLGVIGCAAALSLTGISSMPGGMGFLSADSLTSSAEPEVTAGDARDGVADQGAPAQPSDPAPIDDDLTSNPNESTEVAPAAEPGPPRGSPTAEPDPTTTPTPTPTPTSTSTPTPEPTPSTPPADSAPEETDGILDGLVDLLLPVLP